MLVTIENPKKNWILDSGCSFHMSPYKEWFSKFTKLDGGKLLMGNNVVCQVEGIGSVKVQLINGMTKILIEVRFAPGLKKNLVMTRIFIRIKYLRRD